MLQYNPSLKTIHKFPKIRALKDVAFDMNKHEGKSIPTTLDFIGTTKLHGQNVAIVFPSCDDYYFQSRDSIIDINHGFSRYMQKHPDMISDIFVYVKRLFEFSYDKDKNQFGLFPFVVYFERIGQGVQSGKAISTLEPIPILIGASFPTIDTFLTIDDTSLLSSQHIIYNIYDISPIYKITIDFTKLTTTDFDKLRNITPDIVKQYLISHDDNQVDELIYQTALVINECPVGKYFGLTGNGEGIVWRCKHPELEGFENFSFKTRELDKSDILTYGPKQKVNKVTDDSKFTDIINRLISKNRLQQSIDTVCQIKNTSPSKSIIRECINWVIMDIEKEELEDYTLLLDNKVNLNKYVSTELLKLLS